MEIRVNRVELHHELALMVGVVDRRSSIPVLSHVRLRTGNERLEIAATDLETSLVSVIDAEVSEAGSGAIEAKHFLDIVRASAGDDVVLRFDKKGILCIDVGRSRFKLRGLPAEDFPTLPEVSGEPAAVPFLTFKDMVSKTLYAVSAGDSRYQISAALMERAADTLSLVATDGHRLALVEADVEGLKEGTNVLVPRKVLQEILRFDSPLDLKIAVDTSHISFTLGHRQLIGRLIEGRFPSYEQIIATDNDRHVIFDREALAAAVLRVGLLSSPRQRVMRLELGDEIETAQLGAANPDLGEAEEVIGCDDNGERSLVLGANPDYIRDFLSSCDTEKVRLELKDENTQCVASPVGGSFKRHCCVIMPIRL